MSRMVLTQMESNMTSGTVNISGGTASGSDLFTYTKPENRFLAYYHVEVVLCVITIITNGITIAVIASNAKLRVKPNVYFVSLAVSDFIQGIFGIVFNAARLRWVGSGNWQLFGGTSSLVLQFLWWFATDFSYCCLILIAVERWVFIAHPMFYKRFWSAKLTVGGLLVSGALSFTLSYLSIDKALVSVNVRYVFPTIHTLLSCLIFSAYFHIIAIAYRQQKAISRTEVGSPRRDSMDSGHSIVCRTWRALRMSLTVFVMYFCTVSPWTYFQAAQSWMDPSPVKDEVAQALNTVTCIHFCSNFFVYASQNKDFSDVLKRYCAKIFNFKQDVPKDNNIYTINDIAMT